jgi:hypothetical protein
MVTDNGGLNPIFSLKFAAIIKAQENYDATKKTGLKVRDEKTACYLWFI